MGPDRAGRQSPGRAPGPSPSAVAQACHPALAVGGRIAARSKPAWVTCDFPGRGGAREGDRAGALARWLSRRRPRLPPAWPHAVGEACSQKCSSDPHMCAVARRLTKHTRQTKTSHLRSCLITRKCKKSKGSGKAGDRHRGRQQAQLRGQVPKITLRNRSGVTRSGLGGPGGGRPRVQPPGAAIPQQASG